MEAIYAGIVLCLCWSLLVVAVGFRWDDWAGRATRMMEERGSVKEAS